jgi:hypothetical protein
MFIFNPEEMRLIMREIWQNRRLAVSEIYTRAIAQNEFKSLIITFPKFEQFFKAHISSMAKSVK